MDSNELGCGEKEKASNYSSFFRRFKNNPFEALDDLDLSFFGFQFNLLRDDAKLRKALFEVLFVIPCVAWILLGADSTLNQAVIFVYELPNFFFGKISFPQLIQKYNDYYGIGMHYSASVIYSLFFIGISKHLSDHLDIHKSLNLSITTGLTGITIATFEFFWMGSYWIFQRQSWILALMFPQARIIIQDLLMALCGVIILLGMNYKKYRLNVDRKTLAFAVLTIFIIFLWWNFGSIFSVKQLSVEVVGLGTWTSSIYFPQTMYTIDNNVLDNNAVGDPYFVANEGLHLLNNLCKIFMSLAFYSLFTIKIREEK